MLGEDVAVNAQQYCVLITNVPDVQRMISKRCEKAMERSLRADTMEYALV